MEHISGASSMHCKKNCKTYKLVYDEIYERIMELCLLNQREMWMTKVHERKMNVSHYLPPLDSNNSVEYLKKRLQVLRFSEVDESRRDYDGLKRSRSRKWLYNCEDWSAVGVKTSPISLLRKKEQEWGEEEEKGERQWEKDSGIKL